MGGLVFVMGSRGQIAGVSRVLGLEGKPNSHFGAGVGFTLGDGPQKKVQNVS